MKIRIPVLGLVALGVAAWHAEPAHTQASSQDIQIYAGYVFGDRLTESWLSGERPRLDDDGTFGARYTYHVTDQWGVQLSAGYSPNRAAHVAGGDRYFWLTSVDVDLEWDIPLNLELFDHGFVPYSVIGAGYAWANLDHALSGVVDGTPASIFDGNGVTGNAGVGAKYYLTTNLVIDFDERYRYLSKLVSNYGQGLNTAETSLGVGYRF
jgi:opacity protein-like surface antigen